MIARRPYTQVRYRMGTLVEIRLWGVTEDRAQVACQAAFAEIRRLQGLLSRFEEESELSRVNREAADHPVAVSPDLIEVLAAAQEVARASLGAFDPTCGPWIRLWEKMARAQRLPTCSEWRAAKACVGWSHVRLEPAGRTLRFDRPGISLDLGAAGKGYAVDRAVAVLQDAGIPRGLVDAGGNFKAFGFPGIPSAGVENPLHPDQLLATVDLVHPAIASSSNALRFTQVGEARYGHVVDPRTGWPAHACAGATALAESALLADCISTALLVLGPKGAQRITDFPVQGLLVAPPGAGEEECPLWVSRGLRNHLTLHTTQEVTR